MDNRVKQIEKLVLEQKESFDFKSGDRVVVSYKIKEGNKERIQNFEGDVIQIKGHKGTRTFTVRKMSGEYATERIFPLNSPKIEKITIKRKGKVKQSRIYYLRQLKGKKAKIKEQRK